ncbi:MAG: hypothetical protein OEM39_07245 [Acidimicrobiia bacterium]|nr:hypothetical protein [Acidimicrobiia bacterium]MDH3463233.1 hypothetical protein [Acidimicrobiia bacterium]
MLAALNLTAIGLGLAAGGLAATLVGLVAGGLLTVIGVPDGADIGLLAGVISGLLVSGLVAGRLSVHSHRFHGSVVGLVFAGLLIALASFGAAQVSVVTVIWLATLSAAVGGLGGWWSGRNRAPAP